MEEFGNVTQKNLQTGHMEYCEDLLSDYPEKDESEEGVSKEMFIKFDEYINAIIKLIFGVGIGDGIDVEITKSIKKQGVEMFNKIAKMYGILNAVMTNGPILY